MTQHKFRSITEQQWKSGVPRHRCAECSLDYGHPVHCESSWPLVVVIEDCYIPEYARDVLHWVELTTPEMAGAVVHALAAYAELGLRGSVLN